MIESRDRLFASANGWERVFAEENQFDPRERSGSHPRERSVSWWTRFSYAQNRKTPRCRENDRVSHTNFNIAWIGRRPSTESRSFLEPCYTPVDDKRAKCVITPNVSSQPRLITGQHATNDPWIIREWIFIIWAGDRRWKSAARTNDAARPLSPNVNFLSLRAHRYRTLVNCVLARWYDDGKKKKKKRKNHHRNKIAIRIVPSTRSKLGRCSF